MKKYDIGFGTWHMNGKEAENIIFNALKYGYTHIDTAKKYGNEEAVGRAIIKSGLPREKLQITSKLWNKDKGYSSTIQAFYTTLQQLSFDYIDQYLIHWPITEDSVDNWETVNADTWKAMEYLYSEGRIKKIGVSNFNKKHLEALLRTANIKPMVNQIEFHPGMIQIETLKYCKENNIIVEAWSPLASGRILDNEELKSIAQKYNKTVAQLCLRWCIQNEVIPIVKSTSVDRMKENLNIFDFEILLEDMERINNLGNFGQSGLDPDYLLNKSKIV